MMKKHEVFIYLTKNSLKIWCILLFFLLLVGQISALGNEENKITISKRNDQQGFAFNLQLDPISIDVIDEIDQIDHVDEIVPLITQTYGENTNMPPGNFSGNPFNRSEFDGNPPDWNDLNNNGIPQLNGSRQNGDFNARMQEMFDYIIEAVALDALDTFQYYKLPSDVIEGRMLENNDTQVVYIGTDAQNYFNTSLGEMININNHSFRVIGIFSNDNYSKYIYMSLTDGQTILGLEEDEINSLYVYVDDVNNLEDVSTSIQNLHSDFMIRYQGNIGFNRSPGDTFKFPSETPDASFTPGFEIVLIACALMIFLFFKKLTKGGTNLQ